MKDFNEFLKSARNLFFTFIVIGLFICTIPLYLVIVNQYDNSKLDKVRYCPNCRL